jgi:hypothetical protein
MKKNPGGVQSSPSIANKDFAIATNLLKSRFLSELNHGHVIFATL